MSAHCAPTAPCPDKMVYFVLARFSGGDAWVERDVERVNLADTIDDIRTGQIANVIQVIEVNIAEIISRDVTEDVMKAAGKWIDESPPLFGTDRVNWLHDRARDARKHGEPV